MKVYLIIATGTNSIQVSVLGATYGDKRTRQEAMGRGANDFFQKPVSAMRLYRRMKELLATVPRHYDTLDLRGREVELLSKHRRLWKLRERQALVLMHFRALFVTNITTLNGDSLV